MSAESTQSRPEWDWAIGIVGVVTAVVTGVVLLFFIFLRWHEADIHRCEAAIQAHAPIIKTVCPDTKGQR